MALTVLLPSDPLDPRRCDPHFARERVAARGAGLATGLLDHDALEHGGADDAVRRVPAGSRVLWRGWMLTSAQYRELSDALASAGSTLVTSPEQYQAAHELPGWYAALAPWTPQALWTSGSDLAGLDRVLEQFDGSAVVLRDHVKSAKHDWADACFIPDASDRATAHRVAARFLEIRAEWFTGGLVVRRFEEFVGHEARSWWVGGELVLVTPHPDAPDADVPEVLTAQELTGVAAAVAQLGLPFVTVDLVRRSDGALRVVELGDGQVSDLASTVDASLLLEELASRLA